MGKAKRFNSYDGDVEQRRKLVKSYGQARQDKSVSPFRSSPKSPPTATNINNENVVVDTSVANNSITFAKIQDIATMKVIGRTASGSGDSSEISILDENTMSSNSDTALATQQSIKAYVASNTIAKPIASPLDLNGNQLQGITTAYFNGDADNSNTIAGNSGGLDYNVDDTDEVHDFGVDNVVKLKIGNALINSYVSLNVNGGIESNGELVLTQSTPPTQPTATNTSIKSLTGDMYYNALTNDSHFFQINGTVEVEIDADGIDIRNGWLELEERNEPDAPLDNHVVIFLSNLSGKSRLMARFATGASQQIAIEP